VAGNVASDTELASIEYAASHLHTPVLVVMGHQKCGAVTAAAEGGEAEGHLPSLLALIRPAVDRAKGQPGDLIENAVRMNVENVVKQVCASKPVLAALVDRGTLTVAGAVYSRSISRGLALAQQIHSGMVHVNDQTVNDEATIPFGGMGASGNGARFGGAANWDEFTEWQWVTVRDDARSYPHPY